MLFGANGAEATAVNSYKPASGSKKYRLGALEPGFGSVRNLDASLLLDGKMNVLLGTSTDCRAAFLASFVAVGFSATAFDRVLGMLDIFCASWTNWQLNKYAMARSVQLLVLLVVCLMSIMSIIKLGIVIKELARVTRHAPNTRISSIQARAEQPSPITALAHARPTLFKLCQTKPAGSPFIQGLQHESSHLELNKEHKKDFFAHSCLL